MEIMKIGVSIKPNETTARIYSENQKSNISKYFSNINVSDVTDNKSVWKSK